MASAGRRAFEAMWSAEGEARDPVTVARTWVPGDGRLDLQSADPQQINLVYSGKQALRGLGRRGAAVLDGDWDSKVAPYRFSEDDVYRGLVQHYDDGLPWEETRYYSWVQRRVARSVRKGRSKAEEADRIAKGYIRRFEDTYDSIAENGYRSQGDLGTRHPRHEIEVAIDREGRYVFVDGRHRLAIARLLQLKSVPVRVILRHAMWEKFRYQVRAEAERRNGILYHTVDHPDLIHIPAQHEGRGRLELVLKALEGYDPVGRHLLDIGANWGQVSQQVCKLGFCVTGVEQNRKDAWMAEKIRVATGSPHRIWWGSIFEYPDVEHQDVILALNVFHHLIATKDRYDRLVKLLPRFRADVVVFEPNRSPSSPKFMTRAYKSFSPDEFADWVAEHTGMSTIERQGVAPDGRPVYKLLRD